MINDENSGIPIAVASVISSSEVDGTFCSCQKLLSPKASASELNALINHTAVLAAPAKLDFTLKATYWYAGSILI